MQLFVFLIIIFSILIGGLFCSRYILIRWNRSKRRLTIYQWMKMGRKNRIDLDQEEKKKVMQNKHRLITTIRKEYSNYKKSMNR